MLILRIISEFEPSIPKNGAVQMFVCLAKRNIVCLEWLLNTNV